MTEVSLKPAAAAFEPAPACLVVMHPGAIALDSYEPLRARLAARFSTIVFDIQKVPEYRESVITGSAVDVSLAEIALRFKERSLHEVADVPYAVLGWSFGGVVACALAEAMPADRKPRGVFVLDTIAPGNGSSFGDTLPDREALDWFAMYFGANRGRDLKLSPADFTGVSLEDGLGLVLDRSIATGALTPGTTVHGLRKVFTAFVDGMRRNKQLHDAYHPDRFQVPITLVRPSRGLFDELASLGWDEVAKDEIHTLHCGGDHYTMLRDEQSVEAIARAVEATVLGG
ncbi:thioesterase domain-containing protein [Kutzneria sp. CA-103260]|uniref:thioesterase domain-containing protein n=1 Tax=Kutzneria sp. CA-103260 TaxID=2802641 RepID=UPI001BA9B785|nr:thioesterase domain-containing protein [Kutzneria sp. CA-103260]QUQ72486.1 Thioesterase domain protein [Kutzneria sp. CA-103260]